jgi:hypothetical protein
MSRSKALLALLFAVAVIAVGAPYVHVGATAPAPAVIAPHTTYASEQQWIVSDVATAILAMSRAGLPGQAGEVNAAVEVHNTPGSDPFFILDIGTGKPIRLAVDGHLWSPRTYAPLTQAVFNGAGAPAAPGADPNVRAALVDLRVEVLLDQNERISAMLTRDMRSAAAQESAALLVGAQALRESWSTFGDVRPALSRMAAHLAVADAVRGQTIEGLDGTLARAVLTLLAGRQRDALAIVDGLSPRVRSDQDRAWVRALRLRITGDWRSPMDGAATLLERLEQARALRTRVGPDAMMDFLDTFQPEPVTDWRHIALSNFAGSFNIESGHRFTRGAIEAELAEATQVWSRLHKGHIDDAGLLAELNVRPQAGPFERRDDATVVSVLGWGTWAASEQRQLCHMLTAISRHLMNLGDTESQQRMVADFKPRFRALTLFPAVLRWIATTPSDYERSLAAGRTLVEVAPELVTAAAWNLFAEKPSYVQGVATFPFFATWFTPAVPAGTAFDLHARALFPGCPRPPSIEQAKAWAQAVPYDHWTVWSAEWLAVTGTPTADSIRRAFGPMMDYDYVAVSKLLEYIPLKPAEQTAVAQKICAISPAQCVTLADLLVREGREVEAIPAYERWIHLARDKVSVSNNVMWLVRHYYAIGNRERAEQVARMAAETGSATGIATLAYLLDASGHYAEAEASYRDIADHYGDTKPLGAFIVRKALRTGDRSLELKGWEYLRNEFPTGMERLAVHALDATPVDGIVFATFGQRALTTGLRPTDIIVGVDEWRVRTSLQYWVAVQLRLDEMMLVTVWRGGRYQQLRIRVPERWLGVKFANHRGVPTRT